MDKKENYYILHITYKDNSTGYARMSTDGITKLLKCEIKKIKKIEIEWKKVFKMEISKNKLIMIKEKNFEYNQKLCCSDDTIKFLKEVVRLQEEPEEVLILIAMSSKNDIIGFCEVSRGNINENFTSGREIFKRAIILNSAKIILAHNHTSGDPTPSNADYKTTDKVKKIGDLLDIQLLDHIIIGENENFSIMANQKI